MEASSNEEASSEEAAQEKVKRRAVLLSLRKLVGADAPCAVCEGLFLGSLGTAADLHGLRARGITHVLNLSPLLPCFHPKAFRYLRLQVFDDAREDISQHFAKMNSFIARGRRKGGVLVHCFAGRSRSVAAVLAYLCSCLGLSLAQALQLVLAARPSAQPNSGFMQQLEAYDASLEQQRSCPCTDTAPANLGK